MVSPIRANSSSRRHVHASSLSSDFQKWLPSQPAFDGCDFVRSDVPGGSFGGKIKGGDNVRRTPVVFIHGNSDSALGGGSDERFRGWEKSVAYFRRHGFSSAELYGTTWGDANPRLAALQTHDRRNVLQIRRFIEAVLAYSDAPQVSIVAHSMGVTLARKAILGGHAQDAAGTYDVGPPLTERIDAFVAIAGANRGLASAALLPGAVFLPTTNALTGLFPGMWTPFGLFGQSRFLVDLAAQEGFEGRRRYAMWSPTDELIGFANLVYGVPTGRLPAQTAEAVFPGLGHFELKDRTVAQQHRWIAA